jgi:transposase InsO family protein
MLVALNLEERDEREEEVPDLHTGAEGRDRACWVTVVTARCGTSAGSTRSPDALLPVATHSWVYLHVVVDCCTREVVSWTVDVRTRSDEAIACIEAALLDRNVRPGVLVLGTDNGSQFTSRDFRKHLSVRGVGWADWA